MTQTIEVVIELSLEDARASRMDFYGASDLRGWLTVSFAAGMFHMRRQSRHWNQTTVLRLSTVAIFSMRRLSQ